MASTLTWGSAPQSSRAGQWHNPEGFRWWLKLPTVATPKQFRFFKRLIGPIQDRENRKLGLIARLTYEWFWTDDFYFTRVDEELRAKGQ